MKKIMMVIVALMLMTIMSFSQSRISTSYDEIVKEFDLSNKYVTQSKTDDGQLYIHVVFNNYDVIHYFNNDSIVTTTDIYYKDVSSLNKKIETLNETYVCEAKNSENHSLRWADYSFGYIVTIQFIPTEDFQIIRYSVD